LQLNISYTICVVHSGGRGDEISFTILGGIKFEVLNRITNKTIPLQAWTGPEGSRRLRLPHFKTIGT
jgi:hypothetical protein